MAVLGYSILFFLFYILSAFVYNILTEIVFKCSILFSWWYPFYLWAYQWHSSFVNIFFLAFSFESFLEDLYVYTYITHLFLHVVHFFPCSIYHVAHCLKSHSDNSSIYRISKSCSDTCLHKLCLFLAFVMLCNIFFCWKPDMFIF